MNAIYARVSTDEQVSGYSISAQLTACRGRMSTDVIEYVDDGYSGEFIERPAMGRLRTDLRDKKIQNVMIYDPDRMSRNLTVQLILADEIEKAGAKLMFVTGDYDASPEGHLFFSMKGAISAYEKAKIRERTMSGKRAKAMKGKLTFNDRPLGYDFDYEKQMYTVNEVEAETIRTMFRLYTAANDGVFAVSGTLKMMGIKTKKGVSFSGPTVYRTLKNEMYCGTKQAFKRSEKKVSQYHRERSERDRKDWVAIPVPAIVSRETWELAQRKMKENTKFSQRRAIHEYLLKNIVKCQCCGYSMIGTQSKAKGKPAYFYYCCTSKVTYKRDCSAKNIPAQRLDDAVWERIYSMAKNNQSFTETVANPDNKKNNEMLLKYLDELKRKQTAILRWVNDGTVTIEIAEKELQAINKEINATQEAVKNKSIEINPTITVSEILQAESFAQKRKIMLASGFCVYVKKEQNVLEWELLN